MPAELARISQPFPAPAPSARKQKGRPLPEPAFPESPIGASCSYLRRRAVEPLRALICERVVRAALRAAACARRLLERAIRAAVRAMRAVARDARPTVCLAFRFALCSALPAVRFAARRALAPIVPAARLTRLPAVAIRRRALFLTFVNDGVRTSSTADTILSFIASAPPTTAPSVDPIFSATSVSASFGCAIFRPPL
jgi:hypothetical protein